MKARFLSAATVLWLQYTSVLGQTPVPTTPSPIVCDEGTVTVSGDYNDELLTFYIDVVHDRGNMVCDATNSVVTHNSGASAYDTIGIEVLFPDGDTLVADGDSVPGGNNDLYPDDYLLLGVENIESGPYELYYFVGPGFPPPTGTFGTFELSCSCTTNEPTTSPTPIPTADTAEPTAAPTDDPTAVPTTSAPSAPPTNRPTDVPTPDPTVRILTEFPTMMAVKVVTTTTTTAAPTKKPTATPAPVAMSRRAASSKKTATANSGSASDSDSADSARIQISRRDARAFEVGGAAAAEEIEYVIDPDPVTLASGWAALLAMMCCVSGLCVLCAGKQRGGC